MNIILSKRDLGTILVCLFGFVLFILPFIWIPSGYFINGEDGGMLTYNLLLNKASYIWTMTTGFGAVSTPLTGSLLIPVAVFYELGSILNLDPSITQKLFISFSILTVYISFYLFSRIFTKSKTIFLAGFFIYFFDFYNIGIFSYTAKVFQLILIPLLFFCSYRYFKSKSIKYLLLNYIFVFLFQAIFTNLPQALSAFLIYLVSYFFCLFEDGWPSLGQYSRRLFVLLISIVPVLFFQSLFWYYSVYINYTSSVQLPLFKAIYSNLSMIFQLRGAWWEYGGHNGIAYNNWTNYYDNPVVIVCQYLVVIVPVLAIIKGKNKNPSYPFWLIVFLISIFLTSGGVIFPSIFEFLYKNIPLFNIFREPWAKFIPFVSFSLSALFIILISQIKNHRKIIIFSIAVIIISIIRGFPLVTNKIYSNNIGYKQTFVKPPGYWWQFSEWTKEHSQTNILPIPFQTNSMDFIYDWYQSGNGNTNMFMPYQFSSGNVFLSPTSQPFSKIIDIFLAEKSLDFIKLGKIDYILIQKDLMTIDNKSNYDWESDEIKKYIGDKPDYVFNNTLFIYNSSDSSQSSKIIIPNKTFTTDDLDKNTPRLLNKIGFNYGDMILFRSQNKETLDKIIDNKCTNKPEIITSFINPTLYRLKINNIGTTCNIVFFENYDNGWILKSNNKKINGHFVANGFANGWSINPQEICKKQNGMCRENDDNSYDVDLIIEYTPQRIFNLGIILSGFLFILSSFIVAYGYLRKYSSQQ